MTVKEIIEKKAIRVVPKFKITQNLGIVKSVTVEQLQSIIQGKERCFGTDNGSVAWVEKGQYYIMPYTVRILETLREEGFVEEEISVLISGWKSPADPVLKKRWKMLKAEQAAAQ